MKGVGRLIRLFLAAQLIPLLCYVDSRTFRYLPCEYNIFGAGLAGQDRASCSSFLSPATTISWMILYDYVLSFSSLISCQNICFLEIINKIFFTLGFFLFM